MREKNLSQILLFLTLPITTLISGCAYNDMARPQPLPSLQIPQQTKPQPQHSEPIKISTSYEPQTNIVFEPYIPTPNPIIPIEKIEDVIAEETLFIPSALRNTPEGEIEIISPSDIKKTEIEIPAIQPDEEKKVKVKSGDTLYSIAKNENIKVYNIAKHNNLSAPFILKLGSYIKIPSQNYEDSIDLNKETPKLIPEKTEIITNLNTNKTFIEKPTVNVITIKRGDTIYSISKATNVPLKDLILKNNLTPPYILSIGQKIFIPSTAFHIVKKQETVYSISRKYGVNLNSLVKLNNIKPPYTLTIGQKISLPASNIEITDTQKIKPQAKPTTPAISKEPEKSLSPSITPPLPVIKSPAEKIIEEEIKKENKAKIEKIIIKPQPLTSSRFMWPLTGKIISEFGKKENGKQNDGINISAPIGTKVKATENGIIAYAGNELKGLGNLIIIKHDKDYMTIYAHNDELLVTKGDVIKRGTPIATVGKTGRVTTPQLHFEVRQKTKSINPITILERK